MGEEERDEQGLRKGWARASKGMGKSWGRDEQELGKGRTRARAREDMSKGYERGGLELGTTLKQETTKVIVILSQSLSCRPDLCYPVQVSLISFRAFVISFRTLLSRSDLCYLVQVSLIPSRPLSSRPILSLCSQIFN